MKQIHHLCNDLIQVDSLPLCKFLRVQTTQFDLRLHHSIYSLKASKEYLIAFFMTYPNELREKQIQGHPDLFNAIRLRRIFGSVTHSFSHWVHHLLGVRPLKVLQDQCSQKRTYIIWGESGTGNYQAKDFIYNDLFKRHIKGTIS